MAAAMPDSPDMQSEQETRETSPRRTAQVRLAAADAVRGALSRRVGPAAEGVSAGRSACL